MSKIKKIKKFKKRICMSLFEYLFVTESINHFHFTSRNTPDEFVQNDQRETDYRT